jgi:hypothetical protein
MVKPIKEYTLEIRRPEARRKKTLLEQYDIFCRRQEKQAVLWYMIPLMSLPAAVMPISIFAMSYLPGFIPFIGVSILLFFGNIILNIADVKRKTIITFYFATVLIHILVPSTGLLICLAANPGVTAK